MRQLKAGFFMSLDGVVSQPSAWRGPVTEEVGRIMAEGLAQADAILLGRRTYLEFEEYWGPQGDSNPMAKFLNSATKYVASTTLTDVSGWAGSVLLDGDLEHRLIELKAGPGKNIQVPGSPQLAWWLLNVGLLDELNIMIQPVVVGKGDRLPALGDRIDLERIEGAVLEGGAVSMTYRRAS